MKGEIEIVYKGYAGRYIDQRCKPNSFGEIAAATHEMVDNMPLRGLREGVKENQKSQGLYVKLVRSYGYAIPRTG